MQGEEVDFEIVRKIAQALKHFALVRPQLDFARQEHLDEITEVRRVQLAFYHASFGKAFLAHALAASTSLFASSCISSSRSVTTPCCASISGGKSLRMTIGWTCPPAIRLST